MIILIGGIGKTTIASNLAALREDREILPRKEDKDALNDKLLRNKYRNILRDYPYFSLLIWGLSPINL